MTLKNDWDDGRTTVGPDGSTTTRKYHIRVTGVTFWGATPEQEMEDILRYDNGVIEELTTEEKENTIVHSGRPNDTKVNIFTADIWCERFTPERWQSFGLTAMALNDRAQYEIACAHDKHKQLYGTDQFNSEVQT